MDLDPIKEELLKTDETFKKLYEEHLESKKKVQEIQAKGSLSEEDESEIKRIKVHKLALKDQMEAMAREFQTA